MRNGALVKWQGYKSYITHYNGLPLDPEDKGVYHIEEVDGTNAAISQHGFPHFAGCNHVKKIKLVNAIYIDDSALCQLNLLSKSLVEMEISECPEVTFKGLKCLTELQNLKHLKIGELLNVKDEEINDLIKLLPTNCDLIREGKEKEKVKE
ncbi:ATP synthase subunit s, mitochondrial isoform X2 [Nilaparvata lugens]|nr:ATP synthase subunit s, mitochondrial isoform X2 [Nilaparvata lugens]